jgi:hypothetical protein
MHGLSKAAFAAIAFSMVAAAQNSITADSPFQVRYASNLTAGDSVINVTNTGAEWRESLRPRFRGRNGKYMRQRLCLLS